MKRKTTINFGCNNLWLKRTPGLVALAGIILSVLVLNFPSFAQKAQENITVVFPPKVEGGAAKIATVDAKTPLPAGDYRVTVEASIAKATRRALTWTLPLKKKVSEAERLNRYVRGWTQDGDRYIRPPGPAPTSEEKAAARASLMKNDKGSLAINEDADKDIRPTAINIEYVPTKTAKPLATDMFNGVVVEIKNLFETNPVDLQMEMDFVVSSGRKVTVRRRLSPNPEVMVRPGEASNLPALGQVAKRIDMSKVSWEEKNYFYLIGRELGMPHDDIWRYTTVPDTGRVILQRRFDFDIRPLRAIDFVMTKKVDLGLVLIRVNGRNVPWEKFKISWYERNGEWILRLDMSKWVTGMPWPQATPKFEEMQIFMDQGYNPVKGKDFPIKEVIFRKENMGLVPDKGMEGIFRTDKSPVITYRQGDVTRLLVPIETYNQFLGNKVKGASAPRLVATRFVVDTKNENKWAGVRIRDVRLVRFDDVEIPNYLQRGTDIMSAMGGVEFPSALFPQNVEWAVPLAYQRMGGYSFTVGARERKAELRRKAEKAELRRKAKRDKLRRKFERNMPRWKVKIFKRYWKAKNKRYNRERLMKERKALSAKQWLFDPRTIAREGAEACAAGEKPVVSRRLRGLPYVVSNPAEFPEGRPGHPSTDPKKIKNFPDEQEWPFWSIYWPVNITLPERAYFNVALGDAADIYRVRVVPFVDGEPVAAFVQFPGRRVSLSSLKGKKIDCISVQFLFRSKAADVKVDNLSIVQPRLLSPKEAFETPTYWERETGLAFSDVELPDNYKNLSRWASEGETLNAVTRLKGGNQEPIQWLAEINRPLSEVANVYVDIKFSAAFIPNKDAVLKATLVGDKGTADVLLPLTAASQTLMIDKSRLMESADAIGSSLKRIVFSLKMVKFPYGMDQFMGLKVTMHMDVGEVRDLVSMLIGQSAVSFNDTRLKLGTPVFRDNATSRFSTNVGTIHLLDGDFPLLKGLDDPASLWRLDYLFLTRTNPIDEESWARILKLKGVKEKAVAENSKPQKKVGKGISLKAYTAGVLVIVLTLFWLFWRRDPRAPILTGKESLSPTISHPGVKFFVSIFILANIYGFALGGMTSDSIYPDLAAIMWLPTWRYGLALFRPLVARLSSNWEERLYSGSGGSFFVGLLFFLSSAAFLDLTGGGYLSEHVALIAFSMLAAGVFMELRHYLTATGTGKKADAA